MIRYGISQLPMVENKRVIGTITEESIIKNLNSTTADEVVES